MYFAGEDYMANKLDLSMFEKGYKKVKIGFLTQEVINFLNLKLQPCDIVMWYDRVKYTEKHKKDFDNEEDYYRHIEQIPNIIEKPNYIGLHPRNNSIQYIKRLNKIMLVGIRIRTEGNLNYRSSYPISDQQLQTYIKSGTAWELKNCIDSQE